MTSEAPKAFHGQVSHVASASAVAPGNGDGAGVTEAAEAKGKRLNPIKRQQMKDRLDEVEQGIALAEAAIASCETGLLSFVSAEETQRQSLELGSHRSVLQGLMKEWEELSGSLETT